MPLSGCFLLIPLKLRHLLSLVVRPLLGAYAGAVFVFCDKGNALSQIMDLGSFPVTSLNTESTNR